MNESGFIDVCMNYNHNGLPTAKTLVEATIYKVHYATGQLRAWCVI